MRNRKSFNKTNTRVVNNAITMPYDIDWTDRDGRVELKASDIIAQNFGEQVGVGKLYEGYISSISVEAAEVESVEWNGIVYQAINTDRRYKVKGPLSKINVNSDDRLYHLYLHAREGVTKSTISVTIVTRMYGYTN
jgi:hypothetical protein